MKTNMTKEQLKEQMIDDVLSEFNFGKVHRVMKELDWKWYDEDDAHVPSIYMLIKQAKQLLSEAFDKESEISTCGLIASYTNEVLTLVFALEEKNAYKEDYEERTQQD